MSRSLNTCYSPSPAGKTRFFAVESVPANSVRLVRSRHEALSFPSGSIELAFCPDTGFITNQVFQSDLVRYDGDYEETQGFSDTFSAFHERLADDLIDRYDLRGKTVLEIGCGKGEFLTLLCAKGENDGIGFDPAYRPERNSHPVTERITFIQDFYSEKYAEYDADFVCCKMTLEHIPNVSDFVGMVRSTIGENPETVVFFQVPNVRRILQDLAFWDVYHEHCSYFSAGSLARLFRRQGFHVLSVWTDYDDQYLMIEAKPGAGTGATPLLSEESIDDLAADVRTFSDRVSERIGAWRDLLATCHRQGLRVALWGGGSKAVAFLTTLEVGEAVDAVVDINPYKQGNYLPGTGHRVSAPDDLVDAPPDVVVVMNPIYESEIRADLERLNIGSRLWPVDGDPRRFSVSDQAVA